MGDGNVVGVIVGWGVGEMGVGVGVGGGTAVVAMAAVGRANVAVGERVGGVGGRGMGGRGTAVQAINQPQRKTPNSHL